MDNTPYAKQLRELIRVLERELGVLEESEFFNQSITTTQCHALVEIGRASKVSLNELAAILNLEDSTASRTVNNLVTRGLASRDTDPQDRRYVKISLTPEGQKIFEKIEDSMGYYYKDIIGYIPEDKRELVIEGLNLLLEALSNIECFTKKKY